MGKLLKRWYVVVVLVCVVGFSVGFLCNGFFMEEASASKKDDSDIGHEVMEYKDIFSEDVYRATRNETSGAVSITMRNEPDENHLGEIYKKSDTKILTEKMFGSEYQLKMIDETEYGITYEQYKDGYPTGALAIYTLDDNGNIIQAYFREGSIYNVDESTMISYEEAYELAEKAILNKYGVDIEIKGESKDYEYRIYYRPVSSELCYEIMDIEAYMPSASESGIESVYFYVTVSIDGEFVEVASTLGY